MTLWCNGSSMRYPRQIPAGQYGAVMIDEGHDLKPEWLKLVVQMVDPETNALLLLYDSAQSIYGKHKRLRFSFASLGIQARGRTTILRLNYRNTTEVLSVAYEFAKEAFIPEATARGQSRDRPARKCWTSWLGSGIPPFAVFASGSGLSRGAVT